MLTRIDNREKGNLGENIACKFLQKQRYLIKERNFFRKWGELDIIAFKDNIIHFIEVKSVVRTEGRAYSHTPEENVHGLKRSHIRRAIQTYLGEKNELETKFQFHVVCVFINPVVRKARVKMIKNIIL